MNRFMWLAFLTLSPLSSFAQDSVPDAESGKWIPGGTYAYSGFQNNEHRKGTYANSSSETLRLASYLPHMTIIYQTAESERRSGYLRGVTQSGIPVEVPADDVSSGFLSDRDDHDVVVHQAHEACKIFGCNDVEKIIVPTGQSFSIVNEDGQKIELWNNNELRVSYTKSEFSRLEARGFLTRFKGIAFPRWEIYEGYAQAISVTCGEVRKSGENLTIDKKIFDLDPSYWSLNDDAWSIKAIEIFGLGHVEIMDQGVVGRLATDIVVLSDEPTAIDFSVFAYRDSRSDAGKFRFAGIMSFVNCRQRALNQNQPSYVKEAFFYYREGPEEGDFAQIFPLNEIKLDRQFSENVSDKIFDIVGGTFFYSINDPYQHASVFDTLSKKISSAHAVAFTIARLNASCRPADRQRCQQEIRLGTAN